MRIDVLNFMKWDSTIILHVDFNTWYLFVLRSLIMRRYSIPVHVCDYKHVCTDGKAYVNYGIINVNKSSNALWIFTNALIMHHSWFIEI